MISFDSPRLLADIGGTYARFALETAPGRFEQGQALRCADFADLDSALAAYLARLPSAAASRIEHVAVVIAAPVEGDEVQMTNQPWRFSIERLRQRLGFPTLVVVNDFTALAMSLPRLAPAQRRAVGGGVQRERAVMGLLGAGTGLGMSGVVPAGDGWVALGTEGGHASFSPCDAREAAVLDHARRLYGHVSFERLLSGPGLGLIHQALAHAAGRRVAPLEAPEITQRALAGEDAACVEALEVFCAMLGTAAGNLAVTLGALGGIYIGSGIVPRLGTWFDRSPFRARFEQKGRFSDYLRRIPTYVLTAEDATFVGASAVLAAQLHEWHADQEAPVLGAIRRMRDALTPAEQRVADHVLAQPRSVLSSPTAEIARTARVSQPTVIRFCRSLGCEGVSDFKLRLASALSAARPLSHTPVTREDGAVELGAKVIDNTISALMALRERLQTDALARAIDLLAGASRVEVHAAGAHRMVAEDAQQRLLRSGLPCHAVTEATLRPAQAALMRPGEVALIVSGGGQLEELLIAADLARAVGASVLAVTAPQSPLGRRADLTLFVDPPDELESPGPALGRTLLQTVLDILATGVAMRRGGLPAAAAQALDGDRAVSRRAQAEAVGPGISTAAAPPQPERR
jgi:glucokinase